MSEEKNFVDLVMYFVQHFDYENHKQIIQQYASYRDEDLEKLKAILALIDDAWKSNGTTPGSYRKVIARNIAEANQARKSAGLEAFKMESAENISSIQQGQQYAEVGKWLEIYGESFFQDGRKKGVHSFMELVRLEIKIEAASAIFRTNN